MLRFLAEPELTRCELSVAPVATMLPVRPPLPAYAVATMRRIALGEVVERKTPTRGWRLRQAAKLLLNGSYFIPTIARLARRCGLMVWYSELRLAVYHTDGSFTDYGLGSRRVVTTAGVAYLASSFNNVVEPESLKFHGFGTGATAEAIGDTALVTELTTQYAVANTRPTGTQATATNTYTTVGTLAPVANCTITEHGIFSAASAGTLWDRSIFAGVALVANADTLAASYLGTFPSGG